MAGGGSECLSHNIHGYILASVTTPWRNRAAASKPQWPEFIPGLRAVWAEFARSPCSFRKESRRNFFSQRVMNLEFIARQVALQYGRDCQNLDQ